jgi:O-antigen/teichoic acid export membrane protein
MLIPAWGMLGAAAATAIAYSIISFLYYYKGQRLYPTPYEPRKVLVTIALALPACALGAVAYPQVGLALVLKSLILAGFAVALVTLEIIDQREIRWARERARTMLFARRQTESARSTS